MVEPISLIAEFGLIGLFFTTFLSSSIVPFPLDPAIILALTIFNPVLVFIISLAGSILGGITNYYIGLKGLHNLLVKRSPGKEKKAQKLFRKWGIAILLIAPWVPFFGDPLLIAAGILRMDFRKFLLITVIAKIIRTLPIILLGQAITPILYTLF